MCVVKVLEWAWGGPQQHKPGDDAPQTVIDLSGLSDADLAVLNRVVKSGAIRPAVAVDHPVIADVSEDEDADS
jgi:hypothetical protein